MSGTVFLHYTQQELDRNFDQRGWAPNAAAVIARYEAHSERARRLFDCRRDLQYGASAEERLDLFIAAARPAPVRIFVHGGAWRNFGKENFAFPALAFVPAGVHTAILNFAKLPNVRLPEMVRQVRDGIAWLYRNAGRFGGDPERLYVSAHSSGAHLAAMALTSDWPALGLPPDIVKAATLASGPFDLEAVMLSARSAYIDLLPQEIRGLSPVLQAHRLTCPVTLAYAERDTDEFRRQSRAFAGAAERAGRLDRLVAIPDLNHFELCESLAFPESVLSRLALAQHR